MYKTTKDDLCVWTRRVGHVSTTLKRQYLIAWKSVAMVDTLVKNFKHLSTYPRISCITGNEGCPNDPNDLSGSKCLGCDDNNTISGDGCSAGSLRLYKYAAIV